MTRDAFTGGDDAKAGVRSAEDPLDRYRRDVEWHLGDKLVLFEDESFEHFFEHVIASFSRGLNFEECARTWLRPRVP